MLSNKTQGASSYSIRKQSLQQKSPANGLSKMSNNINLNGTKVRTKCPMKMERKTSHLVRCVNYKKIASGNLMKTKI